LRIAKVEKRRQASLVFSLMEKAKVASDGSMRLPRAHARAIAAWSSRVIGAAVRIAPNTIPFASNIGAERFPS